jgi:hypothetical protein
MEGAMPSGESLHFPTVEHVLSAIAGWVSRYRDATGQTNELRQCSPEAVSQIAKDLGVSPNELRELAGKGPRSTELLQKMLIALYVDPQLVAKKDPLVMRDLQRLCVSCADKKLCARELKNGTAAAHFHEFCPNAFTLDALFEEQHPKPQH